MVAIKDLPGSERPREKLMSGGASSLSNTELLAVIISSGSRGESALSIASGILALEDGGIRELSNIQPEEFMSVRGIGKAGASRIAAAVELGRRMSSAPPKSRLRGDSPGLIAAMFMDEMRHLQQERVSIVMINTRGEVIARENVAIGGLHSACASPREVFTNAVRKGAFGVILAHNHPSGDPSPSDDDIHITKQLAAAGDLLDIKLVDHIIIGDGRFVSLKEMGYI